MKRHPQLLLALIGLGLAVGAARSSAASSTVFRGLCDASAAVALDNRRVVVADDEDNVLRVYDRLQGGLPLQRLDLSGFLRVDPRAPEADIEAGARLGDLIFWITSHGNNVKGKLAPSRHRLFATRIVSTPQGPRIEPEGQPCFELLDALLREPRLQAYDLFSAALLPPKAPGALNIEGLAATPEGHLLIGFRNPVPAGKALIVPLLNPLEAIGSGSPRLGQPVLLDLRGDGIRSLDARGKGFLIVAGSWTSGGESRLYSWGGGPGQPAPIALPSLANFNPESVVSLDEQGSESVFLVSDDGTVRVGRKECKRLKDPVLKSFRGLSLPLPAGDASDAHSLPERPALSADLCNKTPNR